MLSFINNTNNIIHFRQEYYCFEKESMFYFQTKKYNEAVPKRHKSFILMDSKLNTR